MLHSRETTHGSFKVWGTGFRYDYNNEKNALTVFHQDTERLLAQFKFDKSLSENPMAYVGMLEKALQINALMVSNNRTINLADAIGIRQISPIIHSVGGLSRHAFDLHNLALERFCSSFADEHGLKLIKIKPFKSRDNANAFFIARLQTKHDNSISVRACTMTGIMAAMSERTLRDLMTMEFGHRYEGSAHNLLNASSRLSSLSHILDDSFIPEMRVFDKSGDKNHFINSTVNH